jgi:NAD(P)-dependent dehydrogenase (short-subunit alcohol dehydrogenase family)
MSGPLKGRGALVTGGGRGIGAAIAQALADAGASVVVTARTAGEIDAVAAALRRRGGGAWAVAADVSGEPAVRLLAARALEHLGTVDIVVNAAGHGGSAPLDRITLDDWRGMLDAHATGTFLCTREFLPAMRERGFGRVINLASYAGLEGGRYIAHYCAAKHAVVGFTRAVACELEDSGVTINALCPGYVDTPMTSRTVANVVARTGRTQEAALSAVLATARQERLLRPDEVATAALELCGAAGASSNGRAILLMPKGDACISRS